MSILIMHLSSPPWLRRVFVTVAASLIATVAIAGVEVNAPSPLDELLQQHLQPPGSDARGAALEAFSRSTQKTVAELLATEGFFSPDIQIRAEPGQLWVTVTPGTRTIVSDLSIEIRGDISAERRQQLLDAWLLKNGQAFRDADWNEAKQTLLRQLLAVDYPAAKLVDSRAEIDPATAYAKLHVVYDTGPRYIFGGLQMSGLSRYSPTLIERYNKIHQGDPYNEKDLLTLQGALQRTPYFNSVSVEIGQLENPPESGSVKAPILVHVRERPPHRVSFGAGVSTNTGAQTEVIYQEFDFLHRAWQLDTGVRLEQLRQSLYADIRLPSNQERRDSFGTLADWEEIQGLKRRRIAFGAVRSQFQGPVEARYAVNWQREIREPENAVTTTNTAFTLDGAWTLRRVDQPLDPRRGFIAQVQAGGGSKTLLSDQNFLRLHGRYQHFFPIAKNDVVTVRGELGKTLAPSRQGIPQDFLFRTGGAQTVRGYGYQSLGVQEGNAVVGGRYLAVASAEYTHWFNAKWGGAAFIDAGDASDDRRSLNMAVGYGVGARWKSPAGPLAVDLAYGERDQRIRLHFSLAIAF